MGIVELSIFSAGYASAMGNRKVKILLLHNVFGKVRTTSLL
jgi:hypothetical protein